MSERTDETRTVDETDPYFVLDFFRVAIEDAIMLEDGLDAATGQHVLTMIANAKTAREAALRIARDLAEGVRHAKRENAILGVHSFRLPKLAERFEAAIEVRE